MLPVKTVVPSLKQLPKESRVNNIGTAPHRQGEALFKTFNGDELKGTPVATIIDGKIKMKDGKILGKAEGKPLLFN